MPRWLGLYVVLDEKAKTIIGPVVHSSSPVPIIREVTDAVHNEKSIIGKNPEDFGIYLVGNLDEETGQIRADDEPQLITTALALKAATQ